MKRGAFLGQPCYCSCKNVLHGLSVTAEFLVVHVPVFQILLSICYGCHGQVSVKSVRSNSQCGYSHFYKLK